MQLVKNRTTLTSFVASCAAASGLLLLAQPFAAAQTPMAWVQNTHANNPCHGYYQQQLTPELLQTPVTLTQGRTEISADSVRVTLQGESVLSGNVIAVQPGRRLTANTAKAYRDNELGQFTHAELFGDVTLQEAGKVIKANYAYIDLATNTARLENTDIRLASSDALADALATLTGNHPNQQLNITGITARVQADKVFQPDPEVLRLENAAYSTCPPGHAAWHLGASTLQLNRASGFGSAKNVTLYIKEFPVFYWPYLLFPIDDRRRSGVLLPLISLSKSGGVDIAQPVYFDLAPNYDLLITPRYMQKRGVLWQGQFRYLNNRALGQHQGRLRAGIIGHDSDFNNFRKQETAEILAAGRNPPELARLQNASARRDYIHWEHASQINDMLAWHAHYQHVSDDYVLQDFSRLGSPTTKNQLPQQTWLTLESEHWHGVLEYSRYQTLHPANKAKVAEQYRRTPRLMLDGFYPEVLQYFDVHFSGEFVQFDRKSNPGEILHPEVGSRLHIQPGVSLPWRYGLGAYVTPRVDFALTQYDLDHVPAPREDDLTRTLPIISIDAGAVFEAKLSLLGRQYTHTLEPRLYYLYVANRNQDGYPLFDTTQNTFTFEQLFRTNRFSGLDRIGDANQLSVALTSRLLNESGSEKANFNIGSILYLRDRDVQLCQVNTAGVCADRRSLVLRESLSDVSTLSPIVSRLNLNLHPHWQLQTGAAYDNHKQRIANADFSVTYKPQSQQFIQTGVSFLRGGDVLSSVSSSFRDGEDLKQFNTAFVWPISQHWRLLGRYHYNLSHEYTQDYVAGIEYESCCWAARLVAGRAYKGLNTDGRLQYNRAIYLQWQMKGLATVGSSQPSHYLTEQIPGFRDTFASGIPRFN